MDLLASKKLAELLLKLSGRSETPLAVPMRVQKPPFGDVQAGTGDLPHVMPERVGLDSRSLLEFLRRAAAPEHNLHSLTVVRRGKIVLACDFAPYTRDVWHITHSLAKTVTGLAVGILIDEGRLSYDTKIISLFPDKLTPISKVRWKNLTVRHLLSMTSGIGFNELASATQADWLRGVFDSAPQFEPGAEFSYNSINSYVLAAAVRAVTGQTLSAFLRTRIFEPLHIRRFHMETCPLGIEKGGWGMYFLPEDMAKLGVLCASGGVWNGKALVPRDFLLDMAKKQSTPPETMSDYGYGLHAWLWAREGSFLMNGLFGQNVLVLPDLETVLVTTAGGTRLFGKSSFLSLCEEYFGKDIHFPEKRPLRPFDYAALEYACRTARNRVTSFPPAFSRMARQNAAVDGKVFDFMPNGARLLPLFVQVFEHNYTQGLSGCAFKAEGERLFCTLFEGEAQNTLEIGLKKPARCTISANGEAQLAAVSGRWTKNEDDVPVLLVRIALLEQSSARMMKFFFLPNGTLRLHLSEQPSRDALGDGLSLIAGSSRILSAVSDAVGERRIESKLKEIAEPELIGILRK